jgi:hypothetical protein
MRLFPPRCIFVGLVLASVTGSAFGAEMNAAAINSAEPSKKTLSDTKPTPAGSAAIQRILWRIDQAV